MARKRARTSRKSQSSAVMLPGELVVVTRREAAFRSSAGRFESASGQNVSDLASLLKRHGARMSPIFGATEERVMARMAAVREAAHAPTEDLSVFSTDPLYAIRLLGDSKGWIVGAGGRVLQLQDGDWKPAALNLQTVAWLRSIDFFDENNGWIVGGYGTILHTTDGGKSWLPSMG